jgi:hypothetical protein
MCVFPEQPEVELYYGTTGSDVVGYLATALGGVLLGVMMIMRWKS